MRETVSIGRKNGKVGGEPALLIVGHGSRDPRGAKEFHELVELVRDRNPTLPIEGGFIELSRPPIGECVDRISAGGTREVAAVPLMLLAAGHAKDDIPATLVREKMNHPDMSFQYGRALGVRPELLELMEERISAVVPEDEKPDTAVLVVGRGSSDPDANSDITKIARLFYEGRKYPLVESAFISMTPPTVQEGLDRCRKLGARRIVVFSYFLFTGILEERIREQTEAFAAGNGDVEVRYAGYFGPDGRVADLLMERYAEAVQGDIRMNCDVCVHRVALPGFEEKVGAPATPHYHPDEPGHDHGHDHSHGHHHQAVGLSLEDRVRELAAEVPPPDGGAVAEVRERHSTLAKPPGSLGRLEELGARLAGMAEGSPPPVPESPAVVVCAGDHGVLGRGVSPWPREVTAAMVGNFCEGGAAVNAIAKTVGARVSVLDAGVAGELERHPSLRGAKVRPGTDDLSRGPAMGREEAARAVLAGAGVAEELVESGGVDLLVVGDMGIANTTPASALISTFTGRPPEETTGRGTGIDDETLNLKVRVIREALDLHRPDPGDPLGALAAVGGLEHAAIAGVILMGAACGIPVILDGVVSNSAALVAHALAPDSVGYMIAGHLSAEPGARIALEYLDLAPLLDLGMRLGEGTGGLLAVPLVRAAARTLGEMATLEELGFG